MFQSHHFPRWGNERVQEIMRVQRDLYAHLNNQVLHLANQGVTINQVHNVYEVPKSLQQKLHCRGYHGSPEHNSRGVVQFYLSFWDCNPATLIPPSPEDSAPLSVWHAPCAWHQFAMVLQGRISGSSSLGVCRFRPHASLRWRDANMSQCVCSVPNRISEPSETRSTVNIDASFSQQINNILIGQRGSKIPANHTKNDLMREALVLERRSTRHDQPQTLAKARDQCKSPRLT